MDLTTLWNTPLTWVPGRKEHWVYETTTPRGDVVFLCKCQCRHDPLYTVFLFRDGIEQQVGDLGGLPLCWIQHTPLTWVPGRKEHWVYETTTPRGDVVFLCKCQCRHDPLYTVFLFRDGIEHKIGDLDELPLCWVIKSIACG